jgi:hypothetical protein
MIGLDTTVLVRFLVEDDNRMLLKETGFRAPSGCAACMLVKCRWLPYTLHMSDAGSVTSPPIVPRESATVVLKVTGFG